MCCVCSLLSKIISLIVSILSVVLLVLLILWLTGVLFGNDNDFPDISSSDKADGGSDGDTVRKKRTRKRVDRYAARSINEHFKSAGEYKYSAIGSSLT